MSRSPTGIFGRRRLDVERAIAKCGVVPEAVADQKASIPSGVRLGYLSAYRLNDRFRQYGYCHATVATSFGKTKKPQDLYNNNLRLSYYGGSAVLTQNSLKACAPRYFLIIFPEVVLHNHFPPSRPEKRVSSPISRNRTWDGFAEKPGTWRRAATTPYPVFGRRFGSQNGNRSEVPPKSNNYSLAQR